VTIAACYLSPEGVVFGADSTTTIGDHHFDFGQKIFEIGDNASLGIVTWGLGGIQHTSYRTLYAEFAADLKANAPPTVLDAAQRWAAKFFSVYDSAIGDAHRAADAAATTLEEKEKVSARADLLKVGFCIGGITPPNLRPAAFELEFAPTDTAIPAPNPLPMGEAIFRGVPSLVSRILYGIDPGLFDAIEASPHWTGGQKELMDIIEPFVLGQPPMLPLRDAIDWIYSCIQGTIKGVKFSPWAPVCGGPVEIAVITSDRPFRWVRHKSLDAAIYDGQSETHQEAL
jgi:hypothetical protein